MFSFLSWIDWKSLIFYGIVALGVILPSLAVYRVPVLSLVPIDKKYHALIFLIIIVLIALLASSIGVKLAIHSDQGTLFTRAFIIDGIALYILTLDREGRERAEYRHITKSLEPLPANVVPFPCKENEEPDHA